MSYTVLINVLLGRSRRKRTDPSAGFFSLPNVGESYEAIVSLRQPSIIKGMPGLPSYIRFDMSSLIRGPCHAG